MKQILRFLTLCLFVIVAQSCEKENAVNQYVEAPTNQRTNLLANSSASFTTAGSTTFFNTATSTPCGTAEVVDFYAGQNILAGNISISNTSTDLIITLNLTGGWQTDQTHLYVGDPANMPVNPSGNPMIGQFPYSDPHNPMVSSYTWTLPLANLPSCFAIALHADVHLVNNGVIVQSETGWGDGEQFTNAGSWASYYTYCVQSCCQITADTFQVYGGQTIPVGNLIVVNDATNLYVTWEMTGCWELEETHLYVGDAANIPTNNANTPIPGQFPYQMTHGAGTTTYTYTIPLAGLPSCYAIAAHASTLNPCSGNGVQQETAWSDGTPFPNTNRWGWYSNYCTQVCL